MKLLSTKFFNHKLDVHFINNTKSGRKTKDRPSRYGLFLEELEALLLILNAIINCFELTDDSGLTTDREKWELSFMIDTYDSIENLYETGANSSFQFSPTENPLIYTIVAEVYLTCNWDSNTGCAHVPPDVLNFQLHENEKAVIISNLQGKIKTAIDELKEQESEVTHG